MNLGVTAYRHGDPAAARGFLEAGLDLRRDLGAVSYTHLRAHETVLDLVCRLLLEKKKNTLSALIITA